MSYESSDVKVLSDLVHMRKRPGMYIGSTENPNHLSKEAIDNSLDESQNGYCKRIVVSADTKQCVYTVYDEGRGIPIGITRYEYNGIPIEMETLKVLTTVGKAGGKFDNTNYKISGGLHGVGLKCITALSKWAIFETRRDGKLVRAYMKDGDFDKLEYEDTDLPNGTKVQFQADPEIFEDISIPVDRLFEFTNIAKAFGHPMELVVDEEEQELPASTLFDLIPNQDDGTSEYSRFEIKTGDPLGEHFHVAVMYTSDTVSKSYGYVNLVPTRHGGTHIRAYERAIEEVWSEFYSESEIELKPYDCRLGLRSVVALFIEEPSFLGQTKDKLNTSSKDFQHLIDDFKKEFRQYLIDNPKTRQALLKRFEEYRAHQNSLLARKEIMSLIKINEPLDASGKVRRRSVVPGLMECKQSSREGTECHFVEGDSAGGGLGRARDKNTQAILPLGGKIKNVTNLSVNDALKSQEVRDIVNSVGAGVGENVDPNKARYEDFFIDCDADPDGKHITALLISVFVNLLGPLVKEGMVHIVHAPLYGYDEGKKRKYTNDFNRVPKNAKNFTRYKGLGEYDDHELKETILSKENRIVTTLEYPSDLELFNKILGTSKGRSDLLTELGILRYV